LVFINILRHVKGLNVFGSDYGWRSL